MSVSSIVVMIIGIGIIWGGLAASIWHAVKKGRESES